MSGASTAAGTMVIDHTRRTGITLVGFDADDTLWKSEDYYREAQVTFERIVGASREAQIPEWLVHDAAAFAPD